MKKYGAVNLDHEYDEIQKLNVPVMEVWATGALANAGEYRQALLSMGKPKIGCDFSLKTLALENKDKQVPGALLLNLKKKGNETEIFPYLHKFEFPPLQ